MNLEMNKMDLKQLINGPYARLFPESELSIEISPGCVEIQITMRIGQISYMVTDKDNLNKLSIEPVLSFIVSKCYGLFKDAGKNEETDSEFYIFNI